MKISIKKIIQILSSQRNDRSILRWYLRHSDKLKQFENIHDGEDCFIIGNGPSLKQMDLSSLNKYHVFGLNKIFLLLDKIDLKLSYHVSVNPLVIEQSWKQIINLDCPSFVSYLPATQCSLLGKNVFYLATKPVDPLVFNKDIVNVISEGWTVTYVALQIAYYMGFKNVFLIGVDHNFIVNGSPNETQLMNGDDQNHFDPNYFKGQKWDLPDLEGSEISYNLAKFVFSRNNRKIFDATLNGKLQIFDKISFNDALNLCKPKSKT